VKGLLPVFLIVVLVAGCLPPTRVILVYEIDTDVEPDVAEIDVETVARVIRARTYPNRVRVTNDGRIEVGLSDDTPANVARMDRIIRALGTFELRIVANQRDHPELVELAVATDVSKINDETGELLGRWLPLSTGQASTFEVSQGIAVRTRGEGEDEITEILVANDLWNVNGGYLMSARLGVDEMGQPCVNFHFNDRGGRLMAGLTGDNVPDQATGFKRQVAIILNGTVHSAPTINSTIRERGVIEGNFTRQQAEDLIAMLNGGSLPARVKKVGQRRVGGEE
jgi:SecD/SecF fusion protein